MKNSRITFGRNRYDYLTTLNIKWYGVKQRQAIGSKKDLRGHLYAILTHVQNNAMVHTHSAPLYPWH